MEEGDVKREQIEGSSSGGGGGGSGSMSSGLDVDQTGDASLDTKSIVAPDMTSQSQSQLQEEEQQEQQGQQEQSHVSEQQRAASSAPSPAQPQQAAPVPPALKAIGQHDSGRDQSQTSMQTSSSPRQPYNMQPQQQEPQQQQQQHAQQATAPQSLQPAPTSQLQPPQPQAAPVQSPIATQPQYGQAPQQAQYAHPAPPPQQHAQPPPQAQQQQQHQHQQHAHHPEQQLQQQHQAHYQQHQHQHHQQAPQYEHAPPQANGAPPGYAPAQQITPPHHNAYQYQQPPYQQAPPQPSSGDVNGYAAQMRYPMPLPPNQMNAQQLSGTRHKKEIKRRTKTGCLTCRKRRIKCDEGHPTCRNCQKSKRDCLGYDPIFKAQTGQPPNIQPQPGLSGSLPPPGSMSPHMHSMPPPMPPQQHYSNVPQGYVPASSAGYAPAPAMQNQQLEQGYDYATSIDPALAAAHPSAPHPQAPMPPPQEEYTTILLPERNARHVSMDDAFSLDAIPPSFPPPRDMNTHPISQQDIDSVRDLYLREYAPGLDRFFETDWYTAQGLNNLLSDNDLLRYSIYCNSRFRHAESVKGLPSIEARLIWKLTSMAFASPPPHDPNRPPLPFIPRIEAVSHIILGTYMAPENVPPVPAHTPDLKTQPDAYAFYIQDLFWHHLSSFTTIRDDHSRAPSSGQYIADHLAGMRNILDMLENRDVLYSMAIARHFGGRMEHYDAEKLLVGNSNEPEDPINKLVVAMGFLANEECQGTTQVVQRLCGMARRGFQLQRPLARVGSVGEVQGGVQAQGQGQRMEQGHVQEQYRADEHMSDTNGNGNGNSHRQSDVSRSGSGGGTEDKSEMDVDMEQLNPEQRLVEA